MNSSVIVAIEKALLENGYSTLKFNFRSVVNSEGFYGHGLLEERDLEGAIAFALKNEYIKPKNLILIGYSFGAKVAFKVSLKNPNISHLITIGLRSNYPEEIKFKIKNSQIKIFFLAGELDRGANDFTELKKFCKKYNLHCESALIEGADHFFNRNLDRLVEEVLKFLKELK